MHDSRLRHRLEAARVDHDEATLTNAPATIVTVARKPRKIGDKRRAAFGQAIEESRLADIRPADEDEDGEH